MNYLLDTCVLSEYKKLKPESKVIEWLDNQANDSLFLSVLTIGELEKGVFRMPASKRKTDLADFLETLIVQFEHRLLSVDAAIMRRWGKIMGDLESKGRIPPVIDSLMAATALEHGLTIVTRNEDDFAATGVNVLNLWQ